MSHALQLKAGALILGVMTLAAAVGLGGCSRQQETPAAEEAQSETFHIPEQVTQLTQLEDILTDEEGVYCFQEDYSGFYVLTYYDRETATSRPFCSRKGCAHNSANCPACYDPNCTRELFVYGDCLYVLTSDSEAFTLYRHDSQGEERAAVLDQENIFGHSEVSDANLSGRYFDGLSLYLGYTSNSADTAAVVRVGISNNPKVDHDMVYNWMELSIQPAVRWFGSVVNNKVLLRNSMEELYLLDLEKLENRIGEALTLLELPAESGWLYAVWKGKGYFAKYDYDLDAWQLLLVDMETGLPLYHIDTSPYEFQLEYYPVGYLDLATMQCGADETWMVNWDTGDLTQLSLVRWRGDMRQSILPLARCGDEYLVRVRDELYSPFYIQYNGAICVDRIYVGQYAFISVEDYLAGQPNYRIIQEAG